MKIETPMDRLAVDKYFQKVIKPKAHKEALRGVAIFILFICFLKILEFVFIYLSSK